MNNPTPQPKEDWRKTHHPCNVCDKQAIGCYSPDMDIKGLCFCEEHKKYVMHVYIMLLQGSDDMAKVVMKGWKRS